MCFHKRIKESETSKDTNNIVQSPSLTNESTLAQRG